MEIEKIEIIYNIRYVDNIDAGVRSGDATRS